VSQSDAAQAMHRQRLDVAAVDGMAHVGGGTGVVG
jgi:hypothetical protein